MPEEELFTSEQQASRETVASLLKAVADTITKTESVTLKSGKESLTLDIPASLMFEVKAEREGPVNGPGELSVEFELEWAEDGSDGEIIIE